MEGEHGDCSLLRWKEVSCVDMSFTHTLEDVLTEAFEPMMNCIENIPIFQLVST